MNEPAPFAPVSSTDAPGAVRISVDRVASAATGGHLQIRLRPASLPPGVSGGPRVAFELPPAGARELAAKLLAEADALTHI